MLHIAKVPVCERNVRVQAKFAIGFCDVLNAALSLFSFLKFWSISRICPMDLGRVNKIIHVRYLDWFLPVNGYSINVSCYYD
jgi:hypothetical protein